MNTDIKRLIAGMFVGVTSVGLLTACGGDSQAPVTDAAQLLADGEACNPAWVSSTAYVGGNKVSYSGRNYTAAYWTQNNNPSTSSGAAGSGQPWVTGFLCGGTATTTTTKATTTTTKAATTTTATGTTTTTKATTTTTKAGTTTTTATTTTTTKITVPNGGWTLCSNENAQCSFAGTLMVRYGAGINYVMKTMTGGAACNNATFGDPAPGATKHCDIATATQAYDSVADAMQGSTVGKFISSNGGYYIQNNGGNTNFNYWWNANGLDSLTDTYIRTRQDAYKQRMKTLLTGIRSANGNTYLNNYYDDMGWLAISSLRAYENTGDAEYLNVANTLWTDMKTGQHPERSGALQWNKSAPNSFNAIQNSLAVLFATRLSRVNGSAADLQTAKNIFGWIKGNLVDPANGAVWDGYDASNNTTNKSWIFSYNIGVYLGAALELYKTTGDQAYLNDAVKSAEYAMNNRLTNGVFFTNETGGGDGGLFKGIFIRYLALLAKEGNLPQATKDRYENAIKSSTLAMYNQGLNKSSLLVNADWTAAAGTATDYSTQLSGVMLAEAAANLDRVVVYKNVNYAGYASSLGSGSYTLTQLIARGILNDDITSMTVPKGFTVTVYENDNFSGASATFTSSTGWLATWNDRISSLRITP